MQAVIHFSAAATICKAMPFASVTTPAGRRLYQIAVECWLYNLSTLALFHTDWQAIERCIDWTVLDDCFKASSVEEAPTLHRSPFLGGSHGLYKLMFQITCFARKDASLSARRAQASLWSDELDTLQRGLAQYYTTLPRDIANLYYSKFSLHLVALRIFSEKVANHELSASAPIILSHIENARRIFDSESTQEARNPALAWPLIIFLCAADKESNFEFFIGKMNEIDDNFDTGHSRRMDTVLAIIANYRARSLNALDLLLSKNGILSSPDDRKDAST